MKPTNLLKYIQHLLFWRMHVHRYRYPLHETCGRHLIFWKLHSFFFLFFRILTHMEQKPLKPQLHTQLLHVLSFKIVIYTPQKSFAPLTQYSLHLQPSGAQLYTLSKFYDVPVGFVPRPSLLRLCIALFVVAEGWLLIGIGWFVLFLRFWESVTLRNVNKNVLNNTEIMFGYVETNTHIFELTRQLVWKLPKFTFFPKFCKMLEKIFYSLIKLFSVSNHQNSDKNPSFYSSSCCNGAIKLRGGG